MVHLGERSDGGPSTQADEPAPAIHNEFVRDELSTANPARLGLPRLGADPGAMSYQRPPDFPLIGLVRAARRRADLSQRKLAVGAGVSPSTVSRIEAGTLAPSIALLRRLLGVADIDLVAVDRHGRVLQPLQVWADTRDGAERRYPAHLDTVLDPRPGEWWGDRFGLARPPETFYRDRALRDAQRARSRWEVRVAQCRGQPEPPIIARGRPGKRSGPVLG